MMPSWSKVTKNSAVARMEILENSEHIYTDYFCLYKFNEGWKNRQQNIC